MQIQEITTKKLRTKKPRPKKAKSTNGKTPAFSRSNEPAKPNPKKKRRDWLKKKDSILIIGDNAIEGKKKRTFSNNS